MDSFLRRVVALREAEQESAILAIKPESLTRWCRVCGERVRDFDGDTNHAFPVAVCAPCGGTSRAKAIQRQDERASARSSRFAQLLSLAGFRQPIAPEQPMPDAEPKTCPHCGKKLRADNTRGACSACLAKGAAKGAPADEGGKVATRSKGDVVKRFKVVAKALGVEPDKLIAEFCEGWLERVRSSAKFGTDE